MKKTEGSLGEEVLPRSWYNIIADLTPKQREVIKPKDNPKTEGTKVEQLKSLLPKALIEQDSSPEKQIRIPDEVRDLYLHVGRPTALKRAIRLEKYLKTPARIYYKREDLNPCGSYKLNSAIPQVYYAKDEGYKTIVASTGAGNWGSAVALAGTLLGAKCKIFIVRSAAREKPYKIIQMKMYGAEVIESPSDTTAYGRDLLKKNPQHLGNIQIAVRERLDVLKSGGKEAIGVFGAFTQFMLLHQTIIGLEVKEQLKSFEEQPDVLISCAGSGANFSGLIIPFVKDKLSGKSDVRFLVAQTEFGNMVEGKYIEDSFAPGDVLYLTYNLGPETSTPLVHAEGLRVNAAAPVLGLLRHEGLVDVVGFPRDEKTQFDAAKIFVETEGFIPAPESSYAIRAAINEALTARKEGKEKVIVVNISGFGFLDLEGYRDVLFKN